MLLRTIFLLVLALGCPAGLAAEPAPDAETTDSAPIDSEASDSAGDSADEVPAEAAGSLDGEGFVPSVQISEDLSVSFPTDI